MVTGTSSSICDEGKIEFRGARFQSSFFPRHAWTCCCSSQAHLLQWDRMAHHAILRASFLPVHVLVSDCTLRFPACMHKQRITHVFVANIDDKSIFIHPYRLGPIQGSLSSETLLVPLPGSSEPDARASLSSPHLLTSSYGVV